MEKNPDQDLGELIQRELAKLPMMQAPKTLVPRVLAAIQKQAQRPWWRRPWTDWPRGLQAIALVALAALAGGVFYGGDWAWKEYVGVALSQGLSTCLDAVAFAGSLWDTLGRASVIVCRSFGLITLAISAAVVVAMYLTCVGVGTVCFQLAVKRPLKETIL